MTDRVIVEIPIDQIHESPFNPRKRFTGIEEMAETMRPPNGRVQSALLVRPRVPPLFAGDDDAMTGYELVFGHRRRRAGLVAGLPTLPCEVRAMSDAEARHCQIVENLAREDVHPFEEAEGFMQLMREDGLTADEIAEQFKRSRSYVYGRLKLLQACPEVRDACLDGFFGSEVALLISRVGGGNVKLQQKALAGVRNRLGNNHLLDGGKDSFRRVRDYLVDHFSLKLKDAIFETEDVTLLPAAGACAECPKRSGNAPEYEDVATAKPAHHYSTLPCGPDICTDPDCFTAKKTAHLARKAQELSAAGATVINGAKARQVVGADGTVKGGYVLLKDVQAQLKAAGKAGATPELVTVLDQRTGKAIKAVKVASLPASVQPKPAKSSGQHRDWETERREREEAEKVETAARRALHERIRPRMLAAQGSTSELRMIVWLLLEYLDWQVEEAVLKLYGIPKGAGRREAMDQLGADQLRTLLMDLVLEEACAVEDYDIEKRRDVLHMVARLYGVDPDSSSTPSPAGASAEEAAAGADASQGVGTGAKARRAKKSQKDEASAGADAEQTDEAGFAGEHAEAGA